jgi:hypothetical protein
MIPFRHLPVPLAPLLAAACLSARHEHEFSRETAYAASGQTGEPCTDEERGRSWSGAEACEVRTFVVTARALEFRSSNGGVTVTGSDTARAATVRAVVRARAGSDDEARRLVAAVRVDPDGGAFRASGPRMSWGDRSWSVSYRATAPRRVDVAAHTSNGGVRVRDVAGRLRVETSNGGVTLDRVAGDVVARTSNGGVQATLAGRRWDDAGLAGGGLELRTSNGGVVLRLPDGYSARLTAGTSNGSVSSELPVTVQGRVDRRRLEGTLGAGGAPIRVSTSNGSVRLRRAE